MPDESNTLDLVKLWRRGAEAFSRRDLDATMRLDAPDAVVDVTRTVGIAAEGSAAIRSFFEDWLAGYVECKVTLEDPVDLGEGVTFAITCQEARPLSATGYVRQREGVVVIWVESLIANQVFWRDIDKARAAAERLAQERG